jgi:hypothetical protein
LLSANGATSTASLGQPPQVPFYINVRSAEGAIRAQHSLVVLP